jgi:hypothetical protein
VENLNKKLKKENLLLKNTGAFIDYNVVEERLVSNKQIEDDPYKREINDKTFNFNGEERIQKGLDMIEEDNKNNKNSDGIKKEEKNTSNNKLQKLANLFIYTPKVAIKFLF